MRHQPAPAPAPATPRPFGRMLFSLVTLGSLSIIQPIHRPSDSIIRRHDVPDSLYLQLGSRYSSIVHINLPVPGGAADCEGTLIAPRWVLTAAHVAAEITPGHLLTVADEPYQVDSVIRHPDWDDGPNDLALLRLERSVIGVRPAHLYRGSEEVDRVLVLVGYGDLGTGLSGPTGSDRQVRGATNRVDMASDFWLKMVFDSPGEPASNTTGGCEWTGRQRRTGVVGGWRGGSRSRRVIRAEHQGYRGQVGPVWRDRVLYPSLAIRLLDRERHRAAPVLASRATSPRPAGTRSAPRRISRCVEADGSY